MQELKEAKSDDHDISVLEPAEETDETGEETYYITKDLGMDTMLPLGDSLLQLARLPTCAVFHRLTAGRGIPHSFAGMLSTQRQASVEY